VEVAYHSTLYLPGGSEFTGICILDLLPMTRALPELTTPPDAFLTTASLPEGSRASENASSISGGAWRTMLPASGNAWSSKGRAFKADVPPIKNNAATVVLRPNNTRHVIFMRDEQFRGGCRQPACLGDGRGRSINAFQCMLADTSHIIITP